MYKRLKKHSIYLIALLLTAFLFVGWSVLPGMAATDIRLVIDGSVIETSPQPFIHNDRTLVPLRVISEQLGADVGWNDEDRTVHIKKGDRSVLLRIDSRLVEYDRAGEKTYNVSDVAPFIVEDRTVVPLRLVSNALGVDIGWDNSTRTVSIDSSKTAAITPFYDMQISSVSPGQVITGETELAAVFPGGVPTGASEIKYLLLDPGTGRGVVVARRQHDRSVYLASGYEESRADGPCGRSIRCERGLFGRYRHTGATGGAAKGRTGRNNRGTGATGRRYSKAGP